MSRKNCLRTIIVVLPHTLTRYNTDLPAPAEVQFSIASRLRLSSEVNQADTMCIHNAFLLLAFAPSLHRLLAQHLLQRLAHPISNLLGPRTPPEVFCPHTIIQHLLDGLLNHVRLGGLAERVAEHHGGGENCTDRVGDSLAGDIGGGTCKSVSCVQLHDPVMIWWEW